MSANKRIHRRPPPKRARVAAKTPRATRAKPKAPVDATPLSWGERLNIVDALSQVLDGVYAHLPLKRSLYGFDIVRGLEHLRQQLPSMNDLSSIAS